MWRPRVALTTVTLNGISYCLFGDAVHATGAGDDTIDICHQCRASLAKEKLPDGSLVYFDAGLWPADIPRLTWIEELIVSPLRPLKHVVIINGNSTDVWRDKDTFNVRIRGHVVARANPNPDKLLNLLSLPCSPDLLPDDIDVVLLADATSPEKICEMVAKAPALKVIVKFCEHYMQQTAQHMQEQPIRLDPDTMRHWQQAGDSVPEPLQRSAVGASSKEAALAAVRTYEDNRAGYAQQRMFATDNDADLSNDEGGYMAGLDDIEIIVDSDSSSMAAIELLQNHSVTPGGKLAVSTSNSLYSNYQRDWPVLTHVSMFPNATGGPPEAYSLSKWARIQAARVLPPPTPLFICDMFNVVQRHEVNLFAAIKMRANPRLLEELDNMPASEVATALKIFQSGKRGCLFRDAVAEASPRVGKLLSAMRIVGHHIKGSPATFSALRSKCIAANHALGVWTSFLTFNPSELNSRTTMHLCGHPYDVSGDFGAPVDRPLQLQRWKIVAANPVACAMYYRVVMSAIMNVLYGWDLKQKKQRDGPCPMGMITAFFYRAECSGRGALHSHGQIIQLDLQPSRLRELTSVEHVCERFIQWWTSMSSMQMPPGWHVDGCADWAKPDHSRLATDFEGCSVVACQMPLSELIDRAGSHSGGMIVLLGQANEFVARAVAKVMMHGHSSRCKKGGPKGVARGDDADCTQNKPSSKNERFKLLPRCDHGMLVHHMPALLLAEPFNHLIVMSADATRYETERHRAILAGNPEPKLPTLEENAAGASEYANKYSSKSAIDDQALASVLVKMHDADNGEGIGNGRQVVVKALNAIHGSLVMPSTLAALHVLGYDDQHTSFETQAYNPRAFLYALRKACGLNVAAGDDVVMHVSLDANNTISYVSVVDDYQHRPHTLTDVPPYFFVMMFEKRSQKRDMQCADEAHDGGGDPAEHDGAPRQTTTTLHGEASVDDNDPAPRPKFWNRMFFECMHPQAGSHYLRLRTRPVFPQAIMSIPPRPGKDALDDERNDYAVLMLSVLASHDGSYVKRLARGEAPFVVFESWLDSTDRWDVLSHRILHNMDSLAQAQLRRKQRRSRKPTAPVDMQQGAPNASDTSESESEEGFDVVHPDGEEETLQGGVEHPMDVDGEQPLPACDVESVIAKYSSGTLHDNKSRLFGRRLAYLRHALSRLPQVPVVANASQSVMACVSRSAYVVASMLDAASMAHTMQHQGTLEHGTLALREGKLFVVGGDVDVPLPQGQLPMIKLDQAPSLEQTVRLFTLSREQAFAFLLRAKALLAVKQQRDWPQLRLIVTGEPGTGNSQALKAFEWFAFQHDATNMLLPIAYTWRAAINVSNANHPPMSTSYAFGVNSCNMKQAIRIKPDCVLHPPTHHKSFVDVDEYTLLPSHHFFHMNKAANVYRGDDASVFGGLSMTLEGDPCQHTPVRAVALWESASAATTPNKTRLAANVAGCDLYLRQFTSCVFLQKQQRTNCPKQYKFSRFFMRHPCACRGRSCPACMRLRVEMTTLLEELNNKVVHDVSALAGQVPRAAILRNDVRTSINLRLASLHAQHLGVRPIVWRNYEQASDGTTSLTAPEKELVSLVSAADVHDMPALTYFFDGSWHLFVDNNAPRMGYAKNAGCIGKGIVLDPREHDDPGTGPHWMLQYPPRAVFVQPLDGTVSPSALDVMRQSYPDIPDGCIVVEYSKTQAARIPLQPGTNPPTISIRRCGILLGEAYAVTDHYCQGLNFKDQCWLSHLALPPDGLLKRASLFVVSSRYSTWNDFRLLTPLWERGDTKHRQQVIDKFFALAQLENPLAVELLRLRALAEQTKLQQAETWLEAEAYTRDI